MEKFLNHLFEELARINGSLILRLTKRRISRSFLLEIRAKLQYLIQELDKHIPPEKKNG